jgi:hypothetical protein
MSQLVPVLVRAETLRDLQTLARQRGVELADLVDDLVVDAQPGSEDEHAWEQYRHMISQVQGNHLFE